MKLEYHYCALGNYIDELRQHLNVSMIKLCRAIHIGTDTYQLLKGGIIAPFPITKEYWDSSAIFSPKKSL